MEVTDLRSTIWALTRRVADNLERVFQPVCEAHGLTSAQLRVLFSLHEHGCTVGQLTCRLSMQNGNTSALCRKMEKEGLLVRDRDPQDQRVVRLQLTQAGEALVQTIQCELEARYAKKLQRQNAQAVQQIITGLTQLCTLLEQMHTCEEETDHGGQ